MKPIRSSMVIKNNVQSVNLIIVLIFYSMFFSGCSLSEDSLGKGEDDPVLLNPPVVSSITLTQDPRPVWNWESVTGAGRYRHSFTESPGDWIETIELSYTPDTDLPDGTYTLYVQAGNDTEWSGSGFFTTTINSVVPSPPTIDGISNGYYNTNQLFTLEDIEEEATAYYSLNNGINWIEYTGQVTLSDEGLYEVVAKQVVADMIESPASYPDINITIDKTDPDPPEALDLASEDDTGHSDSDNLTRLTDGLSISGSAESDAIITLLSNRDGVVGETTADENGNWTIDISLSENVHSITAFVSDLAGNNSGSSAVMVITVDTTPPSAPSQPDLDAADDSNIDKDNITNISGGLTFNGFTEPDSIVILESDLEGELGTVIANGSGNWICDAVSLGLTNNIHSIIAKAMDPAGNECVSPVLYLTVDTVAPVIRTDKFSSTDKIIVTDTGDSSNFTTESNIISTWNSVTKEVVLEDVAGNSIVMPNMVYEGPETNGLRTAIEVEAVNGDTIYVVAGIYNLTVNPVQLNITDSIAIKGDGASSFITTSVTRKSLFVIAAEDLEVTFTNIKVDCVDRDIIKSGLTAGTVYLKSITRGSVSSRNLVAISNTFDVYYWNSGTGTYKQTRDGVDDWILNWVRCIFKGVPDATHWDE
jgi:hypothetical protein